MEHAKVSGRPRSQAGDGLGCSSGAPAAQHLQLWVGVGMDTLLCPLPHRAVGVGPGMLSLKEAV